MYGGKADSLLKLKNANFNVPEFFIIGQTDYIEFLSDNELLEKMGTLVEDNNYKEISDIILKYPLPISLKKKIEKNVSKAGWSSFAVRSSADNEDGKEKSFAGQYDTFLNVTKDDLEECIKKCWISFYSTNVLAYHSDPKVLGMNVIIQNMVEADYAGVAFSKDPTSDTGNYSVIELTEGLGENLVSGKVTPTKFLVRRQTSRIDLKIGPINIDENLIAELENTILKIEEEYGFPVDIEYAIKDDTIYILQTRPITSCGICTKSYSLTLTRPMSIIEEEIYTEGEYEGIKKLTRNLYYFKPLFIYRAKTKNVDIYYNDFDLEEDPHQMFYYMDRDFIWLTDYYENTIKKEIAELRTIIDTDKTEDLMHIKELMIDIYPFISLGQLAGHFEAITGILADFLTEFRFNHDSIIHEATDFILDVVKQNLPKEYTDYAEFITLEEATGKLPSLETLKDRKEGYIYFKRLETPIDFELWLEEHNISLVEEKETDYILKGDIAYAGTVEGPVCLIFNEEDFTKFTEGCILVTPMTVPKFMEVIKKSAGIVTDEGGITCHASIIARELKKPCIVGTKNATKLLKDGDIVRLDGKTGNVTKLEKEG